MSRVRSREFGPEGFDSRLSLSTSDSVLSTHDPRLLVDPPTAEDAIAVVEDDGLARRDGHLRCGKNDFSPGVPERADRRWSGLVPMTNLRRSLDGRRWFPDHPVDAGSRQRRAPERRPRPHDHLALGWAKREDVHRR